MNNTINDVFEFIVSKNKDCGRNLRIYTVIYLFSDFLNRIGKSILKLKVTEIKTFYSFHFKLHTCDNILKSI